MMSQKTLLKIVNFMITLRGPNVGTTWPHFEYMVSMLGPINQEAGKDQSII